MPLLASEQTPAALIQDALLSILLRPPASPVAETEPQGPKQTCCSPDSRPKPDQAVNGPGWASPPQAHRQDRRTGEQEGPRPRRQRGGSGRPAAIQPGERLWLALRGLRRKAEAGRGRERLHQWLPERLPREKSLWLLPLVPSALGKEGRRGRESGRERVGLRGAGVQGRRAGDSLNRPTLGQRRGGAEGG